MGLLKNILLGGILVLTIYILLTTLGSEPSTDEARLFLEKLQEGDTAAIVTQFGENTCHCQPRGGYIAYLKYQSGESSNLAFLSGQKFRTGEMKCRSVPTIEKEPVAHLPWEKPESSEIDVPLAFAPDVYSPYFLPRDMAFGHKMREDELKKFSADPSIDFWKDLPVRLRPSLKPGLVPPAPPPDPRRKPEFMSDLMMSLLSGDDTRYLRPADAGEVVLSSGKSASASDYEKILPRLKHATLRIYAGRRGPMQRWAVRKARLIDPEFELSSARELSLKTPDAALLDSKPLLEADDK